MLLSLAPMQDVTDLAFMRTLSRVGSLPDFFTTAYFRSSSGSCALSEANLRCILENETGVPVVAQLAGSEAGALVRDARELLRLPVAGINLNAGCPSPLVNRHGAGASLLRDPLRFGRVMMELRQVVPAGAFSVKCRIGWESPDEFPVLLDRIAAAEPDLVIVHGRTRCQVYGGEVCREAVRLAVERLDCPVLGNGDILTGELAREWLDGVCPAGVSIGRGAVRNPFLFRVLRGGSAPAAAEMQGYFRVLAEETGRVLCARSTAAGHCNRMKKYLAFCYQDFSPQQEYALRRCSDMGRMLEILSRANVPFSRSRG